MQEIFDLLNERDVLLEGLEQAQEVSQLFMELINNTRIWENNGHTPLEIGELSGLKEINPFPPRLGPGPAETTTLPVTLRVPLIIASPSIVKSPVILKVVAASDSWGWC